MQPQKKKQSACDTLTARMENSTADSKTLTNKIFDSLTDARPIIIFALALVGVTGNVLSVFIFAMQPNWSRTGLLYLFILAIADTGVLICAFVIRGIIHEPFNLKTTLAMIPFFCKLSVYLWYSFQIISGFIIVLFSLERLYAISFPLKAITNITDFKRRVTLLILFVITFLISSIVFFVYEVLERGIVPNTYLDCRSDPKAYIKYPLLREAFTFFDIVISKLIPCVLLLPINVFLFFKVSSNSFTDRKTGDQKDSSMFHILILISLIYLITTVPTLVTSTLTILYNTEENQGTIFLNNLYAIHYFCSTIRYANFAVNAFVYFKKFEYFIPTLKKFLCCS